MTADHLQYTFHNGTWPPVNDGVKVKVTSDDNTTSATQTVMVSPAELEVSITGPLMVQSGGQYTWTLQVENNQDPVTDIQWYIKYPDDQVGSHFVPIPDYEGSYTLPHTFINDEEAYKEGTIKVKVWRDTDDSPNPIVRTLIIQVYKYL